MAYAVSSHVMNKPAVIHTQPLAAIVASIALAIAVATLLFMTSGGTSRGSDLMIHPFSGVPGIQQAQRTDTPDMIFSGITVSSADRRLVLESLEPISVDEGVSMHPSTAVVPVDENGGGFFNGTCGTLPLEARRREWVSYPLEGFILAPGRKVSLALQARADVIQERAFGMHGLRLTYRRVGSSTQLVQEFPYEGLFYGERELDELFEGSDDRNLPCRQEARAGPISSRRA